MLDFDIQKFTRRCAKSDRPLGPGETFYSALVARGADVVRLDYAADQWSGPPEDVIAWWQARVPDPQETRAQWAPNDVMRHYLAELLLDPAKQETAYVLALLMIRRRVIRLEATETDDTGRQRLLVTCRRSGTEYTVPVAEPSAERICQVQQELAHLLFGDQVVDPGPAAERPPTTEATQAEGKG